MQANGALRGVSPERISKLVFVSDEMKHSEILVIFWQHVLFTLFTKKNILIPILCPLLKANFTVALDTRGFNGHSSISDVLWSGVPIVRLIFICFGSFESSIFQFNFLHLTN